MVWSFTECDHDRGSGHHLPCTPWEDAGLWGEKRLKNGDTGWKGSGKE